MPHVCEDGHPPTHVFHERTLGTEKTIGHQTPYPGVLGSQGRSHRSPTGDAEEHQALTVQVVATAYVGHRRLQVGQLAVRRPLSGHVVVRVLAVAVPAEVKSQNGVPGPKQPLGVGPGRATVGAELTAEDHHRGPLVSSRQGQGRRQFHTVGCAQRHFLPFETLLVVGSGAHDDTQEEVDDNAQVALPDPGHEAQA